MVRFISVYLNNKLFIYLDGQSIQLKYKLIYIINIYLFTQLYLA
jgi:hypothetical protein